MDQFQSIHFGLKLVSDSFTITENGYEALADHPKSIADAFKNGELQLLQTWGKPAL